MYVRVDRQDAELVRPEDLTSLAVVCPAHFDESELVASVRRASLGDVVPGGTHVMVDVEAIRRLAAGRVGQAWSDDLARMLAYAATKGWCSADGRQVRAHVARR